MPKVFVIEELKQGRDVSPAVAYGDITYIFEDRRPPVFMPTEYCQAALDRLRELHYSPDDDFILLAGGLIPNCLLISAVTSTWGKVNLLLFDAGACNYTHKELLQPTFNS